MNNLHVKTGDNVMIISGKDKGHTGKVLQVSPAEGKVIVEGLEIGSQIEVLITEVQIQSHCGISPWRTNFSAVISI